MLLHVSGIWQWKQENHLQGKYQKGNQRTCWNNQQDWGMNSRECALFKEAMNECKDGIV